MQNSISRRGPRRQRGFTLGEVLTTLGVVGVSLSLVLPSLASVTRSNLRAGAINELVGTLHLARSEAITRNTPIVVCPSKDSRTCAPVAWESGWIRFVDANGNFEADAGEAVLGDSPPVVGLRIETDAFALAFGYGPTGRVGAPAGFEGGGDFTFCGEDNSTDVQVVVVSALGHPVLADRRADGGNAECRPA
jgi:type IV fimbrial biogenesis protein FimT